MEDEAQDPTDMVMGVSVLELGRITLDLVPIPQKASRKMCEVGREGRGRMGMGAGAH